MICTAPARPAAGRSSSARRASPRACRSPGCSRPAEPPSRSPRGGGGAAARGPGGLPLARPDNPVTLPIYADNKRDRLGPQAREGPAAVLQLGRVHQHRRRQVVREEVRRQGPDQHVHHDRRGGRQDLQRHRPVRRVRARAGVPRAAGRRQGAAAAEPQLHPEPARPTSGSRCRAPGTTSAARYTVPYTIYTTGIGWRTDKLPDFNPATMSNPWSALWVEGPKISGKVGLLDDQHEGLAMGLLHNGVTDVNTENEKAAQRGQGRADQAGQLGQPEVRHQRVPAPRRRLAVAAPGVVGRHGLDAVLRRRRAPSRRCSATGGRQTGAGRSATTRWRSSRAPRTRCSRTCSSTTCSTPSRCSPTSTSPTTSSRWTR